MKQTFFLFFFFLISFAAFCQQESYTFYMKDGTMFVGELIEKTKDGIYRVKTESGAEVLFNDDQIRRIVTGDDTSIDYNDYGSKQAWSVSLFGAGAVGLHYRNEVKDEVFLDAGLHYTVTPLNYSATDDSDIESGLAIGFTANYFLKRHFKEKKQKVRGNGLFFHGSHTFGTYDATRVSLGWASEYFRANRFNNSFLLELGLGIQFNHWLDDPSTFPYNIDPSDQQGYLHFKIGWIFHLDN